MHRDIIIPAKGFQQERCSATLATVDSLKTIGLFERPATYEYAKHWAHKRKKHIF